MGLNGFSHLHYSSDVDKSRMCCLQPLVSVEPGVLDKRHGYQRSLRVYRCVLNLNEMKELRVQHRCVKNNLNMADEVKISIFLQW